MKHVIPYIRFSLYYTSFSGDKYHEGYKVLRSGDMVGTIDTRQLSGILIPKVTGGILSHVAYCFRTRNSKYDYGFIPTPPAHGKGEEIAEMTHTDFTYSDFFDLCKKAERVVIFRNPTWDDEYNGRVNMEIHAMKHAEYDTEFTMGIKSLYCSELIYQADLAASKFYGRSEGSLQADTEDLMGLGRPYISPDGLLTSPNVVVVWDSEGELTGLTGPEVERLIFHGRHYLDQAKKG